MPDSFPRIRGGRNWPDSPATEAPLFEHTAVPNQEEHVDWIAGTSNDPRVRADTYKVPSKAPTSQSPPATSLTSGRRAGQPTAADAARAGLQNSADIQTKSRLKSPKYRKLVISRHAYNPEIPAQCSSSGTCRAKQGGRERHQDLAHLPLQYQLRVEVKV